MPTYEYRCKDCAHTFDAYQSFTDDALTECPQCGGVIKKVFGNVGISFKGSGFYKTDSRSSGSSPSSSSPGTSPNGDSGSSTSSSSSSSSDSSSSSTSSESSSTKKESTSSTPSS